MVDGAEGDVDGGAVGVELVEGEVAVAGLGVEGGADEVEAVIDKVVGGVEVAGGEDDVAIGVSGETCGVIGTEFLGHGAAPAEEFGDVADGFEKEAGEIEVADTALRAIEDEGGDEADVGDVVGAGGDVAPHGGRVVDDEVGFVVGEGVDEEAGEGGGHTGHDEGGVDKFV